MRRIHTYLTKVVVANRSIYTKLSVDICWGLCAACSYLGNGPLARYLKLRVAHAPGMSGTFSPLLRVNDPDMHHGTCVTHVPWCMPGSLTRGSLEICGGENVPGIPGACATHNLPYLLRGPLMSYSIPMFSVQCNYLLMTQIPAFCTQVLLSAHGHGHVYIIAFHTNSTDSLFDASLTIRHPFKTRYLF